MTEVYKLNEATISEDGLHVTMTMETDSEPIEIEINADALRSVVRDLAGLLLQGRKIADDPNRPASVPEVEQMRVGPTSDQKMVMIGLRTRNPILDDSRIDQFFVMAPDTALSLQRHIGSAAKRCR